MNDWERHVFKVTLMREPDLQRATFLGFKRFKIFHNFKTTFWPYISNFCVLISFQANVLFLYQRIEVQKRKSVRKIFRYFSILSLSKNIEKTSIYLKDDQQIQLILPAKFSRDKGRFLFSRDGKSCISIFHYAIFLLLYKSLSIPYLHSPVNSV